MIMNRKQKTEYLRILHVVGLQYISMGSLQNTNSMKVYGRTFAEYNLDFNEYNDNLLTDVLKT